MRRLATTTWVFLAVLAAIAVLRLPAAHAQNAGDQAGQEAEQRDPASPPINLQPRFNVGQTTRYEAWTQQQQNRTIQVGPRRQVANITTVTRGEMLWTIDQAHSDGSATAVLEIQWMMMTITLPNGQSRTCDTRQGSGDIPQLQQNLEAVAQSPITVELTPAGAVDQISGLDQINARVPQGSPGMSEDQVRDWIVHLATIPQAPEALDIDGSFTSQHRLALPNMTKQIDYRYTLHGIERIAEIPIANIDVAGSHTVELPEQARQAPPGATVDFRFEEGSSEGQIMYDLARGEVVGRNLIETTRFTVTVQSPQFSIQTQVSESTQRQILRIDEQDQ